MFPSIEIPDFVKLSKQPGWDPKLYQPMVYNDRVRKLALTLKPGTLAYDEFWDEMDYYCLNGFKPAGMPRITGRHFYYLNFCKIELLPKGAKKKVLKNPFYRDLDHWLFLEVDAAFKYGYGIILGKPRRVGLSEFGSINCNYELTFFKGAKIGVGAGKEDKSQEFYEKLCSSLDNTHESYKHGELNRNRNFLKLGYTDVENKQKVDKGILSLARIKTMFSDTGAFEGGSYSLVIFEEIGLFDNLVMSYKATEPCFKEGSIQFGVCLLYGTGGNVESGARGFKEIWDNNEEYNLKKIFIPANYYYPSEGENPFFSYETGVTDRAAAKAHILKERERVKGRKEAYVKHLQSYPLVERDIFYKSSGGILDLARLNHQLQKVQMGQLSTPVVRGKLEWVDDVHTIQLLSRATNRLESTKIRISRGSKVRFVEDEDGYLLIDSEPINNQTSHLPYKPDIGGCDSYDDEIENYEGRAKDGDVSSGSTVIYRCFSGPTRKYNKPVAVLNERGSGVYDDDEFYEHTLMLAVFYNSEILIEYTKKHIMNFFEQAGAQRYLKLRPNFDEADTSRHGNRYGVKMPDPVRTLLIKLLKKEVLDNFDDVNFENMILDLLKFGESNTDIAMAYGLCLLHRVDIFDEVTDGIDDYVTNFTASSEDFEYYVDTDGELRVQRSLFHTDQNMNFIPERDLNHDEYIKYREEQKQRTIINEDKPSKIALEAKELGVDESFYRLFISERKNFRKIKI